MASKDRFQLEGVVVDCIKGGKFIVHLTDMNKDVECVTSGKLKQNFIKIIRGDKVTVDISPYDLTKGRIIWRTV